MVMTATLSESALSKVIELQRQYLNRLEKLDEHRKPIYIARNREGSYRPTYWWPWEDWIKPGDPVVYRSVLTNELVFDADYRNKPLAVRYTSALVDGLRELDIPYYLMDSGGKGFHAHVFMKLDKIGRVYTYEQIRNLLWVWILEHIPMRGRPGRIGFAPNHKFDPVLASWNDNSQGRLVRMVGGKKERIKTIIDEPRVIPDLNAPVVFPGEKIRMWRVPHDILDDLELAWKGPSNGCGVCEVVIPSVYVPVGSTMWYGCARCPHRGER